MLQPSAMQFRQKKEEDPMLGPVIITQGIMSISAEHRMSEADIIKADISPEDFNVAAQIHTTREIMKHIYGEFLKPIEKAVFRLEALCSVPRTESEQKLLSQLETLVQDMRNRT